jgi:DNA-binding NarL/FixJ family response regulator
MTRAPLFLLVEPSPILRSSLHDWLERLFVSHRILTAANGEEALRLAYEQRPSHILIEIDLPGQTDFEVVRQMCQILPDAKIVASGWYDNRFLIENVLSAGADGFIRKHKLPRELLPFWGVLRE